MQRTLPQGDSTHIQPPSLMPLWLEFQPPLMILMTAAPLAMHLSGHSQESANWGLQWHVIAMYGPSFFTGGLIARWGAGRVVAAGLPIAVGAAHAQKLQGRSDITVCFFGDGAINRGPFLEALNWAQVHHLPVLFVCEDNRWSATTASGPMIEPTRVTSWFQSMITLRWIPAHRRTIPPGCPCWAARQAKSKTTRSPP